MDKAEAFRKVKQFVKNGWRPDDIKRYLRGLNISVNQKECREIYWQIKGKTKNKNDGFRQS